MENISSEVESKDIKINNFFEVIKVIIYSAIGIIIFFIPIRIDNQTSSLLYHIAHKIQLNYRDLLQFCTVIYITIGTIKSVSSNHKNNL
ncbi:MAG: hypothetical protein IJH34_11880 [Romboutsia sp.]|nr:hypothetical protein [Romboutsia sp.]